MSDLVSLQVLIPEDIRDYLRQRAKNNVRTAGKELTYLIMKVREEDELEAERKRNKQKEWR